MGARKSAAGQERAAAGQQALGVADVPERLRWLRKEHERLFTSVGRKRRDCERFAAELQEVSRSLAGRAGPLVEEAVQHDEAVHRMFAQILERKLSKRARGQIRSIYLDLQLAGVLSPGKELAEDAPPGASDVDDPFSGDDDAEEDERHAPRPPEVHRGRGAELRDLRATFLNLADALHPDKVQDDAEKLSRTEAMKELNRAYRDGDLARLLEIERRWQLGERAIDHEDAEEVARRCAALERNIELLRQQLRELSRSLRGLRRSTEGAYVLEYRRLRRARVPDPLALMIAPLEEAAQALRQVHGFVTDYAEGRMTLTQFVAGPELPDRPEGADPEEALFHELLFTLDEIAAEEMAARPRKGRGRGKGKRQRR
jgi:hypothetical protein